MRPGLRRKLAEAEHRSRPRHTASDDLARYQSLEAFLEDAWHVLEPGRVLKRGPLISALCQHLEAVTRGEVRQLLMNVPGGTAKSLITSVIWPAWIWGPMGMPHLRIIGWSHNFHLSMRDSRRMKLLVESAWFQERWPLALAEDQSAKSRFENDARGWRMAASVGGQGTGERADINIVDDPNDISDANSPAALQAARLWWRALLPPRVNDPAESVLVVIMHLQLPTSFHARSIPWRLSPQGQSFCA